MFFLVIMSRQCGTKIAIWSRHHGTSNYGGLDIMEPHQRLPRQQGAHAIKTMLNWRQRGFWSRLPGTNGNYWQKNVITLSKKSFSARALAKKRVKSSKFMFEMLPLWSPWYNWIWAQEKCIAVVSDIMQAGFNFIDKTNNRSYAE